MIKRNTVAKKILTGIMTIALAVAIAGQINPIYKHPRGSNQLGLAKTETILTIGKNP